MINSNMVSALALAAALFVAAPAHAAGGVTFFVEGPNIFAGPFELTNTSSAGEFITGFGFTLPADFFFDTVDGDPGFGPGPFHSLNGSDVLTGLVGSPSVADGATSLALNFTDFGAGELYSFGIDVDPVLGLCCGVTGDQLIGSEIYVDFSNGLRGTGFMSAVTGNPDAAQLVLSGIEGVPEPTTWAMLIVGFGLVGGALRRRQRVTGTASA